MSLRTGRSGSQVIVQRAHYMSVAFVLGGEVGQVWALRRIRKSQKERLH
ncbi:MAG TPA: hypothetical protein VMM79_19135 [Longimicrobiales bacterium]|nr:hypothetical protein [Longimicrobiales bacterium]